MKLRARSALLSLPFLLPVVATWHPAVPLSLRLASLAIAGLSAVRPAWGLLVVLAILPLATPITVLVHAPFDSSMTAELLVVPFIAAASLRLSFGAREERTRLGWPAAALAAIVAAAAIVRVVAVQEVLAWPLPFATSLWRHMTGDYFIDPSTFEDVHVAMNWFEALALAVLAERVIFTIPALRRSAVRTLLLGAGAAAAMAANRLIEVSLRQPDPLFAALNFLRTLRLNPHFADLNAAGSYYALFAVAAIWMAVRTRWLGAWVVAPLITLALWLTGSRAALAAAVLGLAVAWAVEHRPRRSVLAIGLVAVAGGMVLATVNPGRVQASAELALGVRLKMTRIGLELARHHPIFGVGLNGFKRASIPLVTSDLASVFPQALRGENAHNNFIQILAELGLVGLAAFLALVAAPLAAFRNAVRAGPPPVEATALAGALAAFLVTCLAGHPLLIVQVLFPFMLALGVWAGQLPAPGAPARPRRRGMWIGLAGAALLVVSIPFRMAANERTRDIDGAVVGASAIAGSLDGMPYRRAEARSRWFTSNDGTVILVPLRFEATSADDCAVAVALNDTEINVVRPPRSGWLTVRIPLDAASAAPKSPWIDLTASGAACQLLVGRIEVRR